MLPTQLFSSIQQLSLNQRQLVKGVSEVAPVNARFEIGQKMQGHVLTQMASGTFNVRVANQTVQMPLAQHVRTGDQVDLEVVALQPRLTFNMSASSNPISSPESLSTAAKLFSSLTQREPERAVVRLPQGAALWLDSQPPTSPQLATRLLEALCQSGLFYESHQVQWLAGKRSTAQLLEEAQNKLPPKITASEPSTSPPRSEIPGGNLGHLSEPIQHLVQQQINVLNSGQIVWQGQVWAGQEMQWEIHEEASRQENDELAQQWVTQIHLDLPTLGEVSIRFSFNHLGLSLDIEVAKEETRDTLVGNCPELTASLHEQGITVVSAQVSRNG